MRSLLFSVCVSALSLAALSVSAPTKPSIVVFFVDDLGYGDLGFTGHPTTHTPNIDKLAHEGMILTTWYSGAPLCSASRAAMMTGRVAERVGVPPVFSAASTTGMWTNETTLGQLAKAAGYKTAAIGKWHLGQAPEFMPGSRGFDEYLGIPYSDDMGEARATPCTGDGPANRVRVLPEDIDPEALGYSPGDAAALKAGLDPGALFLPLVRQSGNGSYAPLDVLEQPLDFTTLAQQYSDFATSFIKDNKDGPFLLYMPFSHVHTTAINQPNMQYAGCAFKNTTSRGPFGDALAEVDWIIGNVMAALADAGVVPLTFFTGDNGPWLQHQLSAGSEGLFTGRSAGYANTGKGATWEGGVREAGFAHWPGVIQPGSRSSELVSTLDIFPTVANLTGQSLPTDRQYDGRNMLPVLHGGRSQHDLFWLYNARCSDKGEPCAVRYGPYKAHFVTQPGIGDFSNGPTVTYGLDPPLLFNVDMDPSEANPLTSLHTMPTDPELLDVIGTIKAAYNSSIIDVLPGQVAKGCQAGTCGVCCDRAKNCDCDGPPSALFQVLE